MSDCLSRIGAQVRELDDGLTITGKRMLEGGTVSGYNDHRIVMAMAVAAAVCTGDVVISGAEAVNKSYPLFFEDYRKLGGAVDVIRNGTES
jgi:3-phosphoshikimate 1-carboxyvinyltransferase